MSSELSASLWAVIYYSLNDCIQPHSRAPQIKLLYEPWQTILQSWWVTRLHKNVDEFPRPLDILAIVKQHVTSKNYIQVLGFIESIVRRPECPFGLEDQIATALTATRSAYRLIDETVISVATDEEAAAIALAIEAVRNSPAQSARSHLRLASEQLSQGDWAQAIRESIHAVEAAAKALEPTATTLGPALSKLQGSINLNPAMAKAFAALYGYASNEKGVRHALVFDGHATVGERDALFMFGACAAFVSFLVSAGQDIEVLM